MTRRRTTRKEEVMKRVISAVVAASIAIVALPVQADGFAIVECTNPGKTILFLNLLVVAESAAQFVSCDADAENFVIGETNENCNAVFPALAPPCPVRRGSGVTLSRLFVVDNHPTQDIECSLIAVARDGTMFSSGVVRSSGVGAQDIAGGLTLNPGSATAARVELSCLVPGAAPDGTFSALGDYHVDAIIQ
jgi:hypothetical protein